MSLECNKNKKANDFKEFTIFVSTSRPYRRIFYKTFFIFFGLATEPRSFPTGLFLCLYSSGLSTGRVLRLFICGRLGGKTNHSCDVKKERGCLQAAGIRFKMRFQVFDDPECRKTTVGGMNSYCHVSWIRLFA